MCIRKSKCEPKKLYCENESKQKLVLPNYKSWGEALVLIAQRRGPYPVEYKQFVICSIK